MKNKDYIDDSIKIWGISLFSSGLDQLLNVLSSQVEKAKEPFLVVTPNPEQIIQARNDQRLHQILRQADLAIPDGVGLVKATQVLKAQWGGTFLVKSIPGRLVVEKLIQLGKSQNWHILVIGGQGYAEQATLEPVQLVVQGTSIWWTAGYASVQQPTLVEEQAIQAALSQHKPDIVFVAFGAPWQEYWLADHRQDLAAQGVKVAMTVGGSFDMLLGKTSRPPVWMTKYGWEWLYRLMTQPWRWRRQLRLLAFLGLVLQTWWRRDAAKSQF